MRYPLVAALLAISCAFPVAADVLTIKKDAPKQYVVKKGDTLWDIARRYYRDPFEYKMIAKVNNIENADLIFAKQKIFLPAK